MSEVSNVHEIVMLELDDETTERFSGLPGVVAGIISRKLLGELTPTAFLAETLNRYFLPVSIPVVK